METDRWWAVSILTQTCPLPAQQGSVERFLAELVDSQQCERSLKPGTHGQNVGIHLSVQTIPANLLPVCMSGALPVRTQQLRGGDQWTNLARLVHRLPPGAARFFFVQPMGLHEKKKKNYSVYSA